MARLAHVSNILRVQTHSNPLMVKTYFSITRSAGTDSEGDTWPDSALPKEGNTHPTPDDYYKKSICPSGGHGRGHRLALRYKTGPHMAEVEPSPRSVRAPRSGRDLTEVRIKSSGVWNF